MWVKDLVRRVDDPLLFLGTVFFFIMDLVPPAGTTRSILVLIDLRVGEHFRRRLVVGSDD